MLFYVDQDSVLKLWEDVFGFGGESLFCLVDSLKPAVTEYAGFSKRVKAVLLPFETDHPSRIVTQIGPDAGGTSGPSCIRRRTSSRATA